MPRLPESLRRLPQTLRQREWSWPELPVLAAVVVVVALSAWLFIELADEVISGETGHFDAWAIDVLRDPSDRTLPRGPLWLVDAARDVTALGSTSVLCLIVALVAGYLALVGRRRTMLILLAAVISGALLTTGLKSAFGRPRPPDGSSVQRTHTLSFPSGHSMSAAVVYLTLGAMLARVMPRRRLHAYVISAALALTVLVGLTRVYLGVHYPTDVLAGWAAGAGWAVMWWLIARRVSEPAVPAPNTP